MPESPQTRDSAISPGWKQWWMAREQQCNLLRLNIRLSRPSSSPDPRLHTLTFLCSFHNAAISVPSLASVNIVHYWNEHRKPITQVAVRAGPMPHQPHWKRDSLLRCRGICTQMRPSLELLGVATDAVTRGSGRLASQVLVNEAVESRDAQDAWGQLLRLQLKL